MGCRPARGQNLACGSWFSLTTWVLATEFSSSTLKVSYMATGLVGYAETGVSIVQTAWEQIWEWWFLWICLEIAESGLGFKPTVLPPCDAKENFKVLGKLFIYLLMGYVFCFL